MLWVVFLRRRRDDGRGHARPGGSVEPRAPRAAQTTITLEPAAHAGREAAPGGARQSVSRQVGHFPPSAPTIGGGDVHQLGRESPERRSPRLAAWIIACLTLRRRPGWCLVKPLFGMNAVAADEGDVRRSTCGRAAASRRGAKPQENAASAAAMAAGEPTTVTPGWVSSGQRDVQRVWSPQPRRRGLRGRGVGQFGQWSTPTSMITSLAVAHHGGRGAGRFRFLASAFPGLVSSSGCSEPARAAP